MELKGKKAIITGGVKGIGKEIVQKMIGEGVEIGVFDKDIEGIESLKKSIPDIHCFQCDITKIDDVKASVDKCFEKLQVIDILINNAGILYSAPLISFSLDGVKMHDVKMWDKVISTDLSSVFYVTVNVVEKMVSKRTKGVIINISSVSANGNAGQSAYSAAKAAVNALTATWSKELGPWGIRVAGIAPGFTETESTHSAMNEEALKDIVSKVPLKRLGKVDEIAEGVISVIKNDFINGKVLEIDGGLII